MATSQSIKLRIRGPTGDKLLSDGLTKQSTLAELKKKIEALCAIPPSEQQLRLSYPPPGRVIDHTDSTTLAETGIQSSDTLILKRIEAHAPSSNVAPSSSSASVPSIDANLTPLHVEPIANDNSCLFHAVNKLVEGSSSAALVNQLRQTIAAIILSDTEGKYDEATLGSNKKKYAESIMKENTWGGGIELAILSDCLNVEIAAIDVETCSMFVFGQSDEPSKQRDRRIYVIYSGVHYDALLDTDTQPPRRIFSSSDSIAAQRAILAAKELQQAGAYTNVNKFNLRCSTCREGFVGAMDAQAHAKKTGHQSFEEYKE